MIIAKNELIIPEIINEIIGNIGGVFLNKLTIRAINANTNPKNGINERGNDKIPKNQADFDIPLA